MLIGLLTVVWSGFKTWKKETGYLKNKKYNIKLNFGYYPYPDYEPMSFWGDRTYLDSLSKR